MSSASRSPSRSRSRSRSPMDRKIRSDRFSYRGAPYRRESSRRGFSQSNLCKNCKRPGHFARECPNVAICHNCGLPGLFFIGSVEAEVEDIAEKYVFEEEEEEEEIGEISGQELFNKAENFIGNFYKQLKMQREESWKKIHGFYHKAF